MPLRKAGVSERQVWDLFQAEYDVTSRSKFTEKQWACVAGNVESSTRRCGVVESADR